MSNFQKKVLTSYFWGFFESFSNQAIQFIVGVFIARLLAPEDFGVIAVLSVFIGVAGVLVDGGFKISIIRNNKSSDRDYSTIFFTNLFVGVIISLLFFFSSTFIADYFERPELINITKAFAFLPIINGLGLVQSAILFKKLDFKKNAKISFISNLLSGLLAIFLAYNEYSYWALIWRAISTSLIYTILLWLTSKWRPQFVYSINVLREHFSFSSKILLTGVIDSFFDNLYSLIFGKLFSLKDLAFFVRGKAYAELVSNSISIAIQKVNTPLISSEAKNIESTLDSYRKLLQSSSLLVIGINTFMIIIAEPFVEILLGNKWSASVPYLQILCFVGIIYNFTNSNSALLEVLGRSDYLLKTAIISRPIQIILLLFTTQYSTIIVALGVIVHYFFVLSISLFYIKRSTNKKISFFLEPLFKPVSISLLTGFFLYSLSILLKIKLNEFQLIFVLFCVSIILNVLLFRIFKLKEYQIIKKIVNNINHKLVA